MEMCPNQVKITEKTNSFVYKKTKFDKYGWADAQKYHPIPFDLVTVQTETGKKICAWWNKFKWDGLHMNSNDNVTKWKRRKYEQIN